MLNSIEIYLDYVDNWLTIKAMADSAYYGSYGLEDEKVLKEFINNVDNTTRLKEFYNQKVNEIKKSLINEIKKVKDKATKIKLEEISKFIIEIDKRKSINSDNLVDLLQYYSLLEELKQVK